MAADVSGDGKSAMPKSSTTKSAVSKSAVSKSAMSRRVNKVDEAEMRALGLGTGWTVFSYMISGLVAYGAIGWGIGKLIHASWPFPAGMMVGLAISVGYIIYRYGRQGSVEQARDGRGRVKGNDR